MTVTRPGRPRVSPRVCPRRRPECVRAVTPGVSAPPPPGVRSGPAVSSPRLVPSSHLIWRGAVSACVRVSAEVCPRVRRGGSAVRRRLWPPQGGAVSRRRRVFRRPLAAYVTARQIQLVNWSVLFVGLYCCGRVAVTPAAAAAGTMTPGAGDAGGRPAQRARRINQHTGDAFYRPRCCGGGRDSCCRPAVAVGTTGRSPLDGFT